MNKKIIISLSVIGVVSAILIGGTIAYFSDVAKSEGNTFSTGNADLKIKSSDLENCDTWKDSCTGKTWQNLYPGWFDSYRIWLKNVSASPIVLKIVPFVEETGSSQDLWNNTFMEITWSDGSHSTGRYSLQWWKTNQTIELEPRLAQGEEAGPWIVKFDIPETAGNEIANSQIQFNLVFNGIQTGTGQILGCVNDSECNDQNVCTTDSCVNGQCIFVPNNNSCDDGNICTTNDVCSQGKCEGIQVVCNDNNICTTDYCSPGIGCVYAFNNNPCDDGNVCTTNDYCSNGMCIGTGLLNCDDGDPYTIDTCDPATGCKHIPCTTYYYDYDNDGFGVSSSYQCLVSASGYYRATYGGDCYDNDASIYPGAPESCDNKDNDCDGMYDEEGANGCV
ncbi:MAG: MopE-related protein, partial [candidate division WOR-3 bacterium]